MTQSRRPCAVVDAAPIRRHVDGNLYPRRRKGMRREHHDGGRFVGNKDVDASSIRVETLNGTVMLSGFARPPLRRPLPRPSRARSTA